MTYLELTSYESEKESGNTREFDLAKVEIGKEYKLVVTTYAGLYRYRVGDILRVTRFPNTTPQFKFVQWKGMLLTLNAENIVTNRRYDTNCYSRDRRLRNLTM